MRVIIDRFEGDYAICQKEDESMTDIPKDKLPKNVKEGDILIIENNVIKIDFDATIKRREYLEKLFNEL